MKPTLDSCSSRGNPQDPTVSQTSKQTSRARYRLTPLMSVSRYISSLHLLKYVQQKQGIDRGLYHLCSTHDGKFFSSNKIRANQRRYLYNRKQLQQKGTRSAKRRLKAMSGREKRFMRDVNHCVSKELANQPEYRIFALEDLSGIRNQRRGNKLNKWLSSWSFTQLEFFLSYKSVALGKETVFVDARYTSQRCSRCGNTNRPNRKKSRFYCRSCHFEAHS